MAESKHAARKPGDPVPERKSIRRRSLEEYPEEERPAIQEALEAVERARGAKRKGTEARAAANRDEAAAAWVLVRQARKMLRQGGEAAERMAAICKAAIEGCTPTGNYDQGRADKDKEAMARFLEVNRKAGRPAQER